MISVTKEMIDKARKTLCPNCPIELAILPKLKPGFSVNVYDEYFSVFKPKNYDYAKDRYECPLPEEARLFVDRFDSEQDVNPESFDLDIPVEYLAQPAAH